MPNNYFKFKQFTIIQDKCAMKVGTDGVLLGAWANIKHTKRILDVGTGTGLIALMLAQRSEATIDAIEIDKEAYEQATANILNSPWPERIKLYQNSFQEFEVGSKYDLIVSNPPYFSNSLVNPDKKKTQARHDNELTQKDLLDNSSRHLTKTGKLAVVLPYAEGCLFIAKAANYGLYCIRKTSIRPTPKKKVKRLLLAFEFKKSPLIEDELIIENNKRHDYTKKYIELTKDFYLKF